MGQVGFLAQLPQVLHIVCAVTYLGLAVYVVAKQPRAALNWTCAGVVLPFIHWSIALAISHHPGVSRETAVLAYNIGSLGWASFASLAVLFIATFVKSRLPRSWLFYVPLVLPPLLVINAQWSGRLAADYIQRPWGWYYVWQDSFWTFFFYTYYGLYMLGGLGLLLLVSRRSENPVRRLQARIISLTALAPLLLASVTDIVLPRLGIHAVPNMAPDFILIWVVGVVYAIAKYRMLVLTPSGAADQIVTSMSDSLLLVDLQERVTMSNRAASSLLGYTEAELAAMSVDQLFPVGLREQQLARLRATGWDGRRNLVLTRRDGKRLEVIFSATPIRGTAGEPLGTVCLATDITELKRNEEALRQARDELESRVRERTEELREINARLEQEVTERQRSEERYRSLIESMQEGLWVIDEENRTTFTNRHLAQMLGYDPEELVGKSAVELTDSAGAAACQATLAQTREGTSVQHDCELVCKDGKRVNVIVQTGPLRGEDGGYAGAVLTVLDVTERQRMQAQLAQADRLASLGLLAAGVGHEINNPLAFVLSNLQFLQEQLPGALDGGAGAALRKDINGCVTESLEGARRVRDIVKDLRTFARVDDEEQLVDLNQAIDTAHSMARNAIKYRASVVKEYGELPPVVGNHGRLAQVFLNLLVNAAQAMDEERGRRNEIHISTRCVDGEVRATVRDSGSGIPPEQMDRLFDPFFTTKEVGEGSGLGLAISHQIVTAHQGRIEVESQPGKGASFTVVLPAASGATTAAADHARQQVAAEQAGSAAAASGARVLVVDDEPGLRKMVRRMLGKHHTVEEAINGAEAKKVLERDSAFDVVLCDLMMPDMNGMEFFEWLSRTLPDLAPRVVFMTGGVFTPRTEEFLRGCSNELLAKPFERRALQGLVERMLPQ